MEKKYSGNGYGYKKMKHLANNTTILRRISPKAILTVVSEILPQLKNKIKELTSKFPNLNKPKILMSTAALLAAGTMLMGFSGCSQQHTSESPKQINEVKNSIIMDLGYSPEEVEIVMARDGYHLVYTEKLKEGVIFSSTGEISRDALVKGPDGKIVRLSAETKEELDNAAKGFASNENDTSVSPKQIDEVKNSIIMDLGYSPEEVEIVMARDGYHLVYTEKLKEGVIFSSTGEISRDALVKGPDGKIVVLSAEMKKELDNAAKGFTSDEKDIPESSTEDFER